MSKSPMMKLLTEPDRRNPLSRALFCAVFDIVTGPFQFEEAIVRYVEKRNPTNYQWLTNYVVKRTRKKLLDPNMTFDSMLLGMEIFGIKKLDFSVEIKFDEDSK